VIEHEEYMRRAVNVARGNPRAPFGTILVDIEDQKTIVEGLNRTAMNPILHGEIDAINNYAKESSNRWAHLRLYTTAEPCCMCQSAIIWAGIPEVVFGTSIGKLVEFGWNQFNLKAIDVTESASFARCDVLGGVLADECDRLFEVARTQNG
jgi:tRNA(Arg) A34 adenosine deaminase TadA